MSFSLTGRIAVVTGAASGLGAAIAERLEQAGAQVVGTDIRHGPDAEAAGLLHHDVASPDSWRSVLDQVLARFGRLDILVNNAGVQRARSIAEAEFADLEFHMRVNLGGVYLGTALGIEAMSSLTGGPGGAIVNIVSTYGVVGEEMNAPYCASKGAARAISMAAAEHCRRNRLPIRVNALHPGCCITPLVQQEHKDTLALLASGDGEALWEEWRTEHPIGRLGQPADIAGAVLFLASDAGRLISGADVPVDGGYLAQ